jgi:hypothetical protein
MDGELQRRWQTGKRLVSLATVSSYNINQPIGIEEFRRN